MMNIKRDGELAIVEMTPRFDAASADEVDTALHNKISEGVRILVLDFSQTEFMASAGIRVLLRARKRLGREGGTLKLCAMNEMVRNVLDLTGLTPVLDIHASVAEALPG
jgi:anti-sigma B factor antagonist